MARKRLLSGLGILVGVSLMLWGCAGTPDTSSPPSESTTSGTSGTSRTTSASSSAKPPRATKPANPGAINALCPTSGIPINPRVPTADYAGHKIGFCSNRCEAAWNNWGKAKRDAFVARNK
jgi:hypothetical protein